MLNHIAKTAWARNAPSAVGFSVAAHAAASVARRPAAISRPMMTAIEISWVVFVALALLGLRMPAYAQGDPETLNLPRPAVFLPIVTTVQQVEQDTCRQSDSEKELARIMAEYGEQNRPTMNCNPILQSVARARAEDMARRDYFDHVSPEGFGPNYLVRQAGYALPDWYDQSNSANNVESIAAGFDTPGEVWAAWMTSAPHRLHLLGLHSFYSSQVEYGIAHYSNTSGKGFPDYWVVITAPPAGN